MKHNLVDLDIHPSISDYRTIVTTDVFQDLLSGMERPLWYSLAYIIFALEDKIESMSHES